MGFVKASDFVLALSILNRLIGQTGGDRLNEMVKQLSYKTNVEAPLLFWTSSCNPSKHRMWHASLEEQIVGCLPTRFCIDAKMSNTWTLTWNKTVTIKNVNKLFIIFHLIFQRQSYEILGCRCWNSIHSILMLPGGKYRVGSDCTDCAKLHSTYLNDKQGEQWADCKLAKRTWTFNNLFPLTSWTHSPTCWRNFALQAREGAVFHLVPGALLPRKNHHVVLHHHLHHQNLDL